MINLGDFKLHTNEITSFDISYDYEYAEQSVVEGKPVLQYMGEKRKIDIEVTFDYSASPSSKIDDSESAPTKPLSDTPEKRLEALRQNEGKVLSVSSDSGSIYGSYILSSISNSVKTTTNDGALASINVKIHLQEYKATSLEDKRQSKKDNAPAVKN